MLTIRRQRRAARRLDWRAGVIERLGSALVILIGDLASRTGASIHTINYYLRLGLIRELSRSQRSGYRLFSEETVNELRDIIKLRHRNVSLKEIMSRKRSGLL